MGYLKDYLVELGFDAGKDFVVGKKVDIDIKRELQVYINKQSKFNDLSTLAEEIDFQGWSEYLEGDFLEDVKKRLFGNTKERVIARKEIVNKAIIKSGAENKEAKKRIGRLMNGAVDILHSYYKAGLHHGNLMLAARVEDTVTREIHDSKDEILGVMQEKFPYSIDHYVEMIKRGNIKGAEKNLQSQLNAIGSAHPLFPDYRYVCQDAHFFSRPVSEEAQRKYPPRFLCQAEIKVGDQYITEEIASDLQEYANRHQLKITIDIVEAKKLLGDIPDPVQVEAEQMVGRQAVIEPKPFPPAFPCSIKLNNQTIYEYVELRTEEIMDDGVVVISNREQKNIQMRMTMRVNFADNTVSFSMRTENANNRELLQYIHFMKKAIDGEKISIYVLSKGADIVQGDLGNCDYKGGFDSIEEELAFLEGIVALEDYFHTSFNVTEEIYEDDMNLIKDIVSLINGEEYTSEWTILDFGLTLNEELRQRKDKFDDESANIAFVGELSIQLYGQVLPLQIIRIYECAKLADAEKIRKLIDLLDDGAHLDVKYIPGTEDGKSIYVDRLKTDDEVVKEG